MRKRRYEVAVGGGVPQLGAGETGKVIAVEDTIGSITYVVCGSQIRMRCQYIKPSVLNGHCVIIIHNTCLTFTTCHAC